MSAVLYLKRGQCVQQDMKTDAIDGSLARGPGRRPRRRRPIQTVEGAGGGRSASQSSSRLLSPRKYWITCVIDAARALGTDTNTVISQYPLRAAGAPPRSGTRVTSSSRATELCSFIECKRDRINLTDDLREGRPFMATTEDNIVMRLVIVTDKRVTYHQFRTSYRYESTVQILREYLAVRKFCTRWIAHNLTEAQKPRRINWCCEMMRFTSGDLNAVYDMITAPNSIKPTYRGGGGGGPAGRGASRCDFRWPTALSITTFPLPQLSFSKYLISTQKTDDAWPTLLGSRVSAESKDNLLTGS
ncbi:hypothetical protein EVAR_50867_1 [Eumeta japonica]|uniref:Uncharacterized protein n=1 Tax=Eumeta variegata TaxID=151549 RepID=A0A4C1Y3I2_EUMVA|nr:hypothetical protein EVAR_50867_1 [Eumeta japonica]